MRGLDKRTRVLAILHLCLTFTLVAWCVGYPFMGELFSYRSRILAYQDVMGVAKQQTETAQLERLDRNGERFKKLPLSEQIDLKSRYESIQSHSEKTFMQKFGMSIRILLFELPLFEKVWILLSIVISVLLLMRVEGAWQAAWLLPVLVLCYSWENQTRGLRPLETPEYKLYPSEETIIAEHLHEPWSRNVFEQQRQLKQGWENYVVVKWAKQTPSDNQEIFSRQVEDGEFAFNVARLHVMQFDPEHQLSYFFKKTHSWLLLFAYFLWNVYFAFTVSRKSVSPHKVCG